MPRLTATEHQIQRAVFDWREAVKAQIPELQLLHAIPNGAGVRHQWRMIGGVMRRVSKEGAKLRREGLTAGIPDVGWPVPRGPFHGLYIEHKAGTKGPTDDQKRIISLLRAQGYAVHVSRSADTSIGIITAYWALGPFRVIQGDKS